MAANLVRGEVHLVNLDPTVGREIRKPGHGFVALDQLRTIDTRRLIKRLGRIAPATLTAVLSRLQEMFIE